MEMAKRNFVFQQGFLYLTVRIAFKDNGKEFRAITAFRMGHFISIADMTLLVLGNWIHLSSELPEELRRIFKGFVYCTSGSKTSSGLLSYLGIKVSLWRCVLDQIACINQF